MGWHAATTKLNARVNASENPTSILREKTHMVFCSPIPFALLVQSQIDRSRKRDAACAAAQCCAIKEIDLELKY
jgi:hypothetical protein